MKVLIVDQLAKTVGKDTLALSNLINRQEGIEVTAYVSSDININDRSRYSCGIVYGFNDVYRGNIVHKVVAYIKSLAELKRYINDVKPDIVHLQWFSLPWIEWLFVAEISKTSKVFITVHDVIPFDKRPFEMLFLNKIYSRADHLFIHTEYGRDLFKETYSVITPISVIKQCFCQKKDYIRIDNNEAKKHFNIPSNATVFLYFGTIRKSKGFDTLVRAIYSAHLKNKKVYLLAGGAIHNVNLKEYQKLVDRLLDGSFSQISFEFVPQEKEKWYFSAADVLCLPYTEVTQSGVAQLGLMYELPIIATNIGAMSEVVRQDENGILVDPNNTEVLTDAILKLCDNKSVLQRYSEKSKYLGETDFSLESKADLVSETYKMYI